MRRGGLLDTNHLSDAIMPVSFVRDRLQREVGLGRGFVICIPVLCELEVGLRGLGRPEEPRQQLRSIRKYLRLWPLEGDFVDFYAEVALDAKRRGRTLSQIDIMLAALCRQHGLTLLTSDRDFEALPDIRVENWLA